MTQSELEFIIAETKRTMLMDNYRIQLAINETERRIKMWMVFLLAVSPIVNISVQLISNYFLGLN